MGDKASRQIAAVRKGDTSGKSSDARTSQMPTPDPDFVHHEPKTHFYVDTKKKGLNISVSGNAGKEHEAKKIIETLTS